MRRWARPAIRTLTCGYGPRRDRQGYGRVTMGIGGGQGISLVLEYVVELARGLAALGVRDPDVDALVAALAAEP